MADPRTENEEKFANFLWGVFKAFVLGLILYQCWTGFTM